MVSWLRRVPGLLTLGWGRKPRSGHLPWACCPGQGVEKVDAGIMHFWSADFLLFAANRVLSGKRDRGGQEKLSESGSLRREKFWWQCCCGCQLSEARAWAHLFLPHSLGAGDPLLLQRRWGLPLCPSGPLPRAGTGVSSLAS